jgi:hypothetical protein
MVVDPKTKGFKKIQRTKLKPTPLKKKKFNKFLNNKKTNFK